MMTAALVASPETRYKRVLKDTQRTGHRKPRSFEAFIADEQVDSSDNPNLPNTQAVMDMADWFIDAEPTAEEVLQDLQLRFMQRRHIKTA